MSWINVEISGPPAVGKSWLAYKIRQAVRNNINQVWPGRQRAPFLSTGAGRVVIEEEMGMEGPENVDKWEDFERDGCHPDMSGCFIKITTMTLKRDGTGHPKEIFMEDDPEKDAEWYIRTALEMLEHKGSTEQVRSHLKNYYYYLKGS